MACYRPATDVLDFLAPIIRMNEVWMELFKTLTSKELAGKVNSRLRKRARYLVNNFFYWVVPQYALMPSTIAVVVNSSCNLKCKMCDLGSQQEDAFEYRNLMDKGEMGIDTFKKFIDSVAWFKPEVFFICTEPSIYCHLLGAVEYAHKKGIRVQMTTNGVLLKSLARPLIEAGLDQINISIDADTAELHDLIRGVPGTFKAVNEGIDEIIHIKKDTDSKHPMIGITAAITNYNFSKLENIAATFSQKDIDFVIFTHYSFITKQMCESHNAKFDDIPITEAHVYEADPDLIDPEVLKKQVEEIKRKYVNNGKLITFVPNLEGDDLITYYKKHLEPVSHFNRCYYPWKYCWLLPNGDVTRGFKCFGLKMGNVNEKDFKDIWLGKPYKEFRKRLRKNKLFPAGYRCTNLFSSYHA